LGDVFVLQYLENRGAAFGMLQNQRIFLVSLTVLILAAVLIFYMKLPSKPKLTPLRCSAVLLAAGAVGNLSDRIVRGYVIDFFYVKIINFPIFNVADCYVVVAAILTALLIGFYYKDEDFQ
jgi:signal peptidase II